MSSVDQRPAERNLARHEQPMQQATIDWPEDGHAGQYPPYHVPPQRYAAPPAYAVVPHYPVVPAQHVTVPLAYGAPALGGYGARRRPGAVTAAAALAFVLGGLGTLFSLFYLCLFFLLVAATSESHHAAPWGSALAAVVGVVVLLGLSMSALFVWDQTYQSLARKGVAMTTSAIVAFAYDEIDQARTELERG